MVDKDIMVLQNYEYTNVKKEVCGPFVEMYPASDDADESKNIKAEEVSDAEEEEDPLAITVPKIKAEPEVSCVYVYVHIFRNASCFSDAHLFVCENETTPLCF
jgi:hypothetical protein